MRQGIVRVTYILDIENREVFQNLRLMFVSFFDRFRQTHFAPKALDTHLGLIHLKNNVVAHYTIYSTN